MTKFKIKTIDKRQRVGAVRPTKAKTSKNVQTDTILKEWLNPDFLIEVFDKFGKKIAKLKNQRRDRLKKRKYSGIELTNQALHFWALDNYAKRKQAENEQIRQSDVFRLSSVKLRGQSTISIIDLNFKHSVIDDDILELQLIKEVQVRNFLQDRKDNLRLSKTAKLVDDFYKMEKTRIDEIKQGRNLKPINEKEKQINILASSVDVNMFKL